MRSDVVVDAVDSCGGASATVPAGTPWSVVVERAVAEGWVGVEALAGIPGSTGATPVQNVGAYGQEVAGVVSTVRTWDRAERRQRTFAVGELGFGYRTSVLKRSMREDGWGPTPRYVVLDVGFQLRLGTLSAPIGYAELARRLGVEVGERAPMADVRAAVLELRAGKGMVVDPADHDTWSAGSFFTNPVVRADVADALPEGAPRYPVRTPRPEHTTGPEPRRGRPRPGQDQRRLVDRARRVRQGLRAAGPGRHLDQAHPRAHPPRRRDDGASSSPSLVRCATGSATRSASSSSPSRCWSASASDGLRRRRHRAGP